MARVDLRRCGWALFLAVTAGCTSEFSVNDHLLHLPSWEEFSPPLEDVAPHPTGDDPIRFDEMGTYSNITDEDTDGDGFADVDSIADVLYRCMSVPYTMTDTPERIVMYSPDVEILWPGALIQGRSHRDGVGSLEPLPIAERAPIEVSIPAIATGENFRLVEAPTQARVAAAVGDIIEAAQDAELIAPSTVSFEEQTYDSESQFALSLGISGRYLNFEASASGSFEEAKSRNTVTAQFMQKMFEVVVAPPATPGALFTEEFTPEKYDEQVRLGRIGDDNLPVYVSNVVYGRMMTFSLTSTASETEIRATLSAAYDALVGGVEAELDAQQRSILSESEIAVSSLGGNAEASIAMIRSGNWREYFDVEAPITTAAPLSYTFRNLGDNSIAHVAETTEYNITSCVARAQGDNFDLVQVQEHEALIDAPFTAHAGDFNGDGFGDLLWNHRGAAVNSFYIGFGSETGTLQLSEAHEHPVGAPGGWAAFDVEVGDFDGDGADEVAWVSHSSGEAAWYVMRWLDEEPVFDNAQVVEGTWDQLDLKVGDLDGDGRDDLVFYSEDGILTRIYAGLHFVRGQGFEFLGPRDSTPWIDTPSPPHTLGAVSWHLVDADLDGDDDVVMDRFTRLGSPGGSYDWHLVSIAESNEEPNLHGIPATKRVDATTPDYQALTGYFAGLPGSDLVLVNNTAGEGGVPRIYRHRLGSEAMEPAIDHPTLDEPWADFQLYAGDVDGDGRQDLIWNYLGSTNDVYVGFGRPDGIYLADRKQRQPWTVPSWSAYEHVLVVDVDGDGRDDIVWNQPGPTNRVFLGLASSAL